MVSILHSIVIQYFNITVPEQTDCKGKRTMT